MSNGFALQLKSMLYILSVWKQDACFGWGFLSLACICGPRPHPQKTANRKQNRNKPLLVYLFHEFNLYLYLNPLEGILNVVVKFGSYSVKFFWNCSAGDEGPVIVIFSATCVNSDFWRWFPSVFQPLLQHITSCHVTLFVMQPEYPEKLSVFSICHVKLVTLDCWVSLKPMT